MARHWLFILLTVLLCRVVLAEDRLAKDLHESILHVGVTVSDLGGVRATKSIPLTVYRPDGAGPFPLIVLNHGRKSEDRELPTRYRMQDAARYFVDKGFAVIVPTRVGYGETFGSFDPESAGSCRDMHFGPMTKAAADEVMAAVEYAKALPFIDTSRWIVAGVSVGGLVSDVVVGMKPPGLIAGINFSGGMGGNPDKHPRAPCDAAKLTQFIGDAAHASPVPMLWLYWQNDLFWGEDLPKAWHQAWLAGGGVADFHEMDAFGDNGHYGMDRDMAHWLPVVDAFLVKLGFDKPALITPPPASNFAKVDDIGSAPFTAAQRDGYRKFLAAKSPRAFSFSPDGAWGYAYGDTYAYGKAVGFCKENGHPNCVLYAVDDQVVWAPKAKSETLGQSK